MNIQEFRDWYRVRPGYWFRPKLFGWGAVPVTWQGWALTLGIVALALPIKLLAEQRSPAWFVLLVPLVAGAVWLCWTRTDGSWRWRWGNRD